MNDRLSRRDLLQTTAAAGALSVLGAAGCSKQAPPLVCTDTTGLAPADLAVRTSLAYSDVSMEAGKLCSSCQQYLAAPAASACGTCKILKGPINPRGYCKSYVAKAV